MNRYFTRLAQRSDLVATADGVRAEAETIAWGEESLETGVSSAIGTTAPDDGPMPVIAPAPAPAPASGPERHAARTTTPGRIAAAVTPATAGHLPGTTQRLALPADAPLAATTATTTVSSRSASPSPSMGVATTSTATPPPAAERDAMPVPSGIGLAGLKPGNPQRTDMSPSLRTAATVPRASSAPAPTPLPSMTATMAVGSDVATSTTTTERPGEKPAAAVQVVTAPSPTRAGNLRSRARPLANEAPVRADVPHAAPVQVSIGRIELTLHAQSSAPTPAPMPTPVTADVPVHAESSATPRFNPHRHYLRGA